MRINGNTEMIIQPTAILMSHLFADAADFSSEDIMKTIPAAPPNIKAHIFTIGIKELYAFVNWVEMCIRDSSIIAHLVFP